MEELGLDPLGFVATDYATLIWGLAELTDPAPLLEPDALRDGLERWLAENAVMKRAFRGAATIAGLIERNSPGARKSGRQATFSSDILYDTLRKYDPGHLLLDITRDEALSGLVDCARIEEMADRIRGRVTLRRLKRISPLAAPLLLEMGKVPVQGAGAQKLLEREAEELMRTSGLAELDP